MSWQQIRFGDLYMIPSRNGLMRPSRVRGEGIKMVNMGELFANQLIGDIPMERVPMNERELANSSLAEGDLLFARQSLVLEGAGQCSYVASLPEPTTFESHLIRVRIDQAKAIPLFYHYYFRSPFSGMSTIVQQCAQAGIRASELAELKVGYPSIDVQKAVVDLLAPYDTLIENNRRRMALLEESARLLYREWFVGLRFPGYEHTPIVDGVPQGWDRGTVSDFYETSSGGTPSRKVAEYFTGEIPWVKTQELSNGFITETGEHITDEALKTSSAKLFPNRTVLIALYGATVGELGITAMPAATNQACCAVLHKDPRGHYAHAFLYFRENKEVLVGLSAGAAQKNISQQIVRGVPMVMPTNSLMSMFTDIVSPMFEQMLNFQLANQKLRTARDLLLPRLMSGELAV